MKVIEVGTWRRTEVENERAWKKGKRYLHVLASCKQANMPALYRQFLGR